ncbi:MAG: TRAP transporter substrate-binding protein DctP [Spirochaetota bacterium]|nr:TRAP transporter substrate-binding protein DctP [Spirochaetota bacterium]
MADRKPKYVWKLAMHNQETIRMINILTLYFTQRVMETTNWDMKFVWYGGGIMGDEKDYIEKMKSGQLQGAGIIGPINEVICPGISVLELPFLFDNWDEVIYVRKKMRSRIDKIAEKNKFKVIAMIDVGFEHLYSTKYPLRTPEDFEKSKILTWHGSLEVELLKALGATPVPLSISEIVPSIRAGVVDSCISPSCWWLTTQLYRITKYINPIPIRYDTGLFVVLLKTWNRIPDKYKTAILIIASDVENRLNNEGRQVCTDALQGMIDYGCEEVKMTSEEIELFRIKTKPLWEMVAGRVYSQELLDEVMNHLEMYRAMDWRG